MEQALIEKYTQILADKKTGIGGSDAPVVLGKSPWKSPLDLWQEKLGLVEQTSTNAHQERGMRLESMIVDIYKEETGNRVNTEPLCFRHQKSTFMISHPDGIISMPTPSIFEKEGVLEIKAPALRTFRDIERTGIPEQYLIQLQHNMHVTGLPWAHFCAFNAELWRSVVLEVAYDAEFCELLVEKERVFWQCVETKTPPPEIVEPILVDLPPVGGAKILQVEKLDARTRTAWQDAIQKYQEAISLSEAAEAMKEDRKQELITLLGSETVAEGFNARIYHTEQAGRKTFDAKAFAKARPDIDLSPYYKQGSPFKTFKTYFMKGAGL